MAAAVPPAVATPSAATGTAPTAPACTAPALLEGTRRRDRPPTPDLVGPDDPRAHGALAWSVLLRRSGGLDALDCPRVARAWSGSPPSKTSASPPGSCATWGLPTTM